MTRAPKNPTESDKNNRQCRSGLFETTGVPYFCAMRARAMTERGHRKCEGGCPADDYVGQLSSRDYVGQLSSA